MNILQYDLKEYNICEVQKAVNYLNSHGLKVVAIPKDFDLLIDCDTYTLHYIKNKIEDAIREKEIIEN